MGLTLPDFMLGFAAVGSRRSVVSNPDPFQFLVDALGVPVRWLDVDEAPLGVAGYYLMAEARPERLGGGLAESLATSRRMLESAGLAEETPPRTGIDWRGLAETVRETLPTVELLLDGFLGSKRPEVVAGDDAGDDDELP